jgi:hypothetical protein
MAWDRPKQSSTARGYGAAHQRERKRWAIIVNRGEATCCLCGKPITPGTKWHLDHTPDRTAYRGVACATCNIRDGAKRGNAKSRGLNTQPRRWIL